jgi:hypothetical protein
MSQKAKCKALVSSIGIPFLKKGGEYYFDVDKATDYAKRGFIEILEIPEPEKAIMKERPTQKRRRK